MCKIVVSKKPAGLVLSIFDTCGVLMATSVEYRTICKLEVGPKNLYQLVKETNSAYKTDAVAIKVFSAPHTKINVHFSLIAPGTYPADLLVHILSAIVVDARESSCVRTNLSGPLSTFF